jgi:AcrR family transcriptional regulator
VADLLHRTLPRAPRFRLGQGGHTRPGMVKLRVVPAQGSCVRSDLLTLCKTYVIITLVMTQRAFFTKEAVIDTAFALAREKGWGAVSARSIARRLGSSTMPIYSSLKSMEEIERETRKRAEILLQEYQTRPYTENPSLSLAVGYVAFARQEPHLFRFLYVDAPRRRGPAELELQSQEFQTAFSGTAELKEMIDRMPAHSQDVDLRARTRIASLVRSAGHSGRSRPAAAGRRRTGFCGSGDTEEGEGGHGWLRRW